jgi:RNA polymerase sigma-70 factor (ECF subfamily)
MSGERRQEVTRVLEEMAGGDEFAAGRLMDLVYDQLRALAGAYFRGQPAGHTLQPTALVHEAFVKLAERTGVHWEDRTHFLAVAAVAMRGILADYARKRRAQKRGGDRRRVTLADVETPGGCGEVDVLALDDALERLAELNHRQAAIVEYRFFSGLTVEEIARTLGVSVWTVEEDWRMARAWLSVQLEAAGA